MAPRPDLKARDEDSRIGKLAVARGWITDADLQRLLKVQNSMLTSGIRRKLGQMMIMHDLISQDQLDELIRTQTRIRSGA